MVHLAGLAGVRPSVEQPHLYQEVNILGTLNLLEESRNKVDRFVFASSSSVYGNNPCRPLREDMLPSPVSPYGASKAGAELLCSTYHHLYGLPVVMLRFFTVYGPRQRPDMAFSRFTQAIERGQPIQLFGPGDSRRDYTYVGDIVQGLEASLGLSDGGCHILNLGSARPVTLESLVHLLERALDKKALVEHLPPQPGDVEVTEADISRARQVLGYHPQVSLEEGLARFVQWYYDHSRQLITKP